MDFINKFKLLKQIGESIYLTADFFEYYDGGLKDLLQGNKDFNKKLEIIKLNDGYDIKGGIKMNINSYINLGRKFKMEKFNNLSIIFFKSI